jgi:flagellar M-ring protein FliF
MTATEQMQRLFANLLQMGGRRLAIMGVVALSVFAMTGVVGYYLSRPSMETLYAGLDRQDVSSIGAALRDADIAFDVSADGASVSVHYGQTAQARMLLAEKGLPHSSNAGYELYDKMGSLGLTSFMQDVTRVRALEGELARTIQSMSGVRAARVHIVLPDEGSFRRSKQPATASVLLRAETLDDNHAAQAIRHLVAAAVPGMTIDQVTVVSTDGTVLASGEDSADGGPGKMLSTEKLVARTIQDDIKRTLTPSLGASNLEISVSTKLNMDAKQTAETIYNPDGRVERSTRTVKDLQTSQNSAGGAPTTVNQNLPQQAKPAPGDGKTSSEQNDKREELNNYEVSSKTISTTSAGYAIEKLSIAVVLNKSALAGAGTDKASPDAIAKKLADIEQLVASAAGFDKARGDTMKVMAVDFVDGGHDLEAAAPPGIGDAVMRQAGTLINAGAALVVTLLVVFLVVRPVLKTLAPPSAGASGDLAIGREEPPMLIAAEAPIAPPTLPDPMLSGGASSESWQEANLIEDLTSKPRRSPQKRLEQMIEFDEKQAAAILKQWVHQRSAA